MNKIFIIKNKNKIKLKYERVIHNQRYRCATCFYVNMIIKLILNY